MYIKKAHPSKIHIYLITKKKVFTDYLKETFDDSDFDSDFAPTKKTKPVISTSSRKAIICNMMELDVTS